MKKNPYKIGTTYESDKFYYRQVKISDAQSLLACYSDERAVSLFNSDNCASDFYYRRKIEMINCIKFWNSEYKSKYYIRYAVIDKNSKIAIGTLEFFAKKTSHSEYGRVGVLRIDLCTEYESQEMINDILIMVEENFVRDFDVDVIITKAIPLAFERIDSLRGNSYKKIEEKGIVNYEHYYLKTVTTSTGVTYGLG